LEIVNDIGGRRRWSVDDKARIVEETLAPGAVASLRISTFRTSTRDRSDHNYKDAI
jgi:transposase-like protein